MKKWLPFILLFSLMLSGCASEKLVKVSGFRHQNVFVSEGETVDFEPLQRDGVLRLYFENKGCAVGVIGLFAISKASGEESLYKSIRLEQGEKRIVILKPSVSSEGESLDYRAKLIGGSGANILIKGEFYGPEGSGDKTEAEFQKELESLEGLVERVLAFPILEKTSEKQVPFELEPGVKHFSIAYEGIKASETEVSLYRTSDNSLIMSGKALPSIRLNSENTFTLNGQKEAFYVILKELEYKPLEGELILSFQYEG